MLKAKLLGGVVVFAVVAALVVSGLFFGQKQISCGGDWSYDVKCPIGTYCKPIGGGPLVGGICTPYLDFGIDFSSWDYE